MSLRRPDYSPGQFYHIYNRGAHHISIFKDTENYLFVIRKLKQYCSKYNLSLICYCLMPNHYHLLIRQDGDQPAGLLPQRVFNSYSKAYNKRYGHSGTLFEGNYRVKTIQTPSYLLHVCRYIHNNPVKDGFVKNPADWPYSNFLEFTGEREGALYDPQFVMDHFGDGTAYRNFAMADLYSRDLPAEIELF